MLGEKFEIDQGLVISFSFFLPSFLTSFFHCRSSKRKKNHIGVCRKKLALSQEYKLCGGGQVSQSLGTCFLFFKMEIIPTWQDYSQD